ncbi:uncharacterized protein LOC123907661 isoform X3 [Trifolium pratense]|uniref:uncharacterized protein LOC123907661 isoform X3 n=1 Tax=Trifolium pratense TaxID=57577 RepID=UPI001E698360|nr:uncharacterized protein LOC123907661 isoform X3 [Trifolium pratense]
MKDTSVASVGIVPEVLTFDNYDRWSVFMKNYLIGKDLWDVVTSGDDAEHLNNTPDVEKGLGDSSEVNQRAEVSLKKKNAKALHIIQLSCGRQIQNELFDFELARDAWNHLSTRYDKILKIIVDKVQQDDDGLCVEQKKLFKMVKRGDSIEGMEVDPNVYDVTTSNSERTLLHIAVNAGNPKNVEILVTKGGDEFVKKKDKHGDTALALAACYNAKMKIVKTLVNSKIGKMLLMEPNEKGEIPIHLAAGKGYRKMTCYLYEETPVEVFNKDSRNRVLLLDRCIEAYIFGLSVKQFEDKYGIPEVDIVKFTRSVTLRRVPNRSLRTTSSVKCWSPRHFLMLPGQLLRGFRCSLVHFLKDRNVLGIRSIYTLKFMNYEAQAILKYLIQNIKGFNGLGLRQASAHEAMLYAAKNGSVEFINAMREVNPDLLSVTDNGGRGIFWHAILNRRQDVFQLVYFLNGMEKDMIRDHSDNELLHMAAVHFVPSSSFDNDILSPVMQIQRELQWFQAVAGVVHPICLDAKNEDGKKPFAVFYESHQELLKAAEQWTKGTAGTYITVASLVLTIMFAAAFTIPGGNNQQTGMPIFLDEKIFNMFLIADMVSIFVSASCVLVFIGILTSRYQAMDFYYALPWKLIIGIVLFLLSICSMMVALYAALSLILKGNHTGSRGFILGFMLFLGGVPVIILLVSQLRFIYKFIRSTIKNPVSSI